MKLGRYFKRGEFACKCGCGFSTVDIELLAVLEDVREHFNKPVIITSGCRCGYHNSKVGGALNSKHLEGIAADFIVGGVDEGRVADYLEKKYSNKYGIGRYQGRTHVDVRQGNKARWTV